jgi:PAS domain-containing protein
MPGTELSSLQAFTSTQLVRDLASIRSSAAIAPVGIASHSRVELVLMTAWAYQSLLAGQAGAQPANLDAKLTTLLDSIDSQVLILDSDLKIRRMNRAFQVALGLQDPPVAGEPILGLLPSATGEFFVRRMQEVLESGSPTEFEFPATVRPGRIYRVRILPWPGGVLQISDDVTDRLAAVERDLAFTAVRRSFTALGGLGSGTIDDRGMIIDIDQGLADLLGTDASQIIAIRLSALFDPRERSAIDDAIASEESAMVLDTCLVRRSTDVLPVRLAFSRYFTSHGRVRLAFAVEDISRGE